MNRFLLLMFFIFSCGSAIFSQEKQYFQTVRGVVIDIGSQVPLPGAYISIIGKIQPKSGISNESGEFIITGVPLGRYDIQVSLLGYKPLTLPNITVKSGKEIVLEIELEELVIFINEVEISGDYAKEKPLNEMAQISARSFTVEETERYAGTWLDPARMATNFAGVMTAGDQRNDIIIRGNSPLGLLWRLEGVDIPNPNHFGTLGTTGGPISILNNNLLNNSDFFTSAFPAEYGNATSGVFDLNLRNGNNHKHEFVAQVGMNGFELGAEGPISQRSKSSYLLSYRYSTLKIFDAFGISFGVSGAPQYQDFAFKFNFPGTKASRFALFGIGGNSYIELLFKNRKPGDWSFGREDLDMRFGSGMATTGISHLFFINKDVRVETVLAASIAKTSAKADSAFDNQPSLNYYGDASNEKKISFSTKYSKKFSARDQVNFGLMADLYMVSYIDSTLRSNYTYIRLTNSTGNSVLLQAFGQWQHKFTDKLVLYSGLHFQYFTLNASKAFEPRASLKYSIDQKHELAFGFGFHSQLQPRLFYFLETTLPDGGTYKTNLGLEFSKSDQFVISYDYKPAKTFRIKMETYYQFLHHIPVETNSSAYSIINYGTEFYSEREDSLINKGKGRNFGIEFTFEKFLSKNYYFLCTASLFESLYHGSDNIERSTAYNGNYVLNFLTGYTFNIKKHNSLSFDIKLVNAGGRHYIPVDLDNSRRLGTKILDYTQSFVPQYPPYFRFDGRISFKLNRLKYNMEMAVDLQNLTQHQNVLLETYNKKTGTISYDYQLGLFYVFLLRFQF